MDSSWAYFLILYVGFVSHGGRSHLNTSDGLHDLCSNNKYFPPKISIPVLNSFGVVAQPTDPLF